MLGEIEGSRKRGRQHMGWIEGITEPSQMKLQELNEVVRHRNCWWQLIHEVTRSRHRLDST